MTGPVILPASTGFTDTYTLQFEDTFSEDGAGAGPYWAYDTLDDALNRTGNQGQGADGVLGSGSVNGKRWSAWANGNNDSFVYRNGGLLYIGGQVLDEPDPTRINYSFGGVNYNWANIRPEVPYMVQWGRVYDDVVGAQVHDLTKPDIYFGPNHFVEIRISVEEMKIPGFRVSLWLTPIIPNESLSYDSSAANGVEIDILEIEKWIDGGYANGRVQSKVLGGDAGSTVPQSGGNVDLLNDHDIDITTGFHTFGLRWDNDGLYWLCDGYEYILDIDHVPQTNHYLSLTRELNSGVYDDADSTQIPSNGVKVPQDIGLFGVSSYTHLDHMPDDKAIVDYIRVWSIDGRTSYFNNPNTSGDSSAPVSAPSTESYVPVIDNQILYRQGHTTGEFFFQLATDSTGYWDYSSYGADAIAIGPTDEPTLVLRVTGAVDVSTPREIRFIFTETADTSPRIIGPTVGGVFSLAEDSPRIGAVTVGGVFSLS